ncbi:MAG: hypothetical protein BAJALOKI1v1_880011 [Promethearchaeota archaeon]|nr:MAG: hypothetical protein BAJALOKI1v1_880011 [Candidatus Lokiarchaeota archaeon]
MICIPKEPRKVGIKEGKFYPCPEKQVCVSTQAPKDDELHYIEPIKYEQSLEEVKNKVKTVINSMSRTKILEESDNYLRVQFTSFLFRFKDDVEFYFDDASKILHFRSQSRIGGFDWGANRNRMEKFKEKYLNLK